MTEQGVGDENRLGNWAIYFSLLPPTGGRAERISFSSPKWRKGPVSRH